MNELKSYTEYAVSTPTADFVIGFDFNYGEDAVNVTVDNVPATEAGYTVVYLNETTIRLSPSVPSGVVRLQRETDIDQTDHAYRAGAKFIAQTMDENFEQLRHSQQEVRDGFSKLSTDTHEIIEGLDAALELAQDAAQDAQDAALIAQGAADTVNTIIVGGKVGASNVLDASGETQQQVNYNGGSKWHSRIGGYKLNERVVLTNGDIVKSITNGNTNDPNVNMTGWITGLTGVVKSKSELESLLGSDGQIVLMTGYYSGQYLGGDHFIYDSTQSSINNGVTIINGWVKQFSNGALTVSACGADPSATDHSVALELAVNTATSLKRKLVVDFDLKVNKTTELNATLRIEGDGGAVQFSRSITATADIPIFTVKAGYDSESSYFGNLLFKSSAGGVATAFRSLTNGYLSQSTFNHCVFDRSLRYGIDANIILCDFQKCDFGSYQSATNSVGFKAIRALGVIASQEPNANTFYNCIFRGGSDDYMIEWDAYGTQWHFFACDFEQNNCQTGIIKASSAGGVMFSGGYIEANATPYFLDFYGDSSTGIPTLVDFNCIHMNRGVTTAFVKSHVEIGYPKVKLTGCYGSLSSKLWEDASGKFNSEDMLSYSLGNHLVIFSGGDVGRIATNQNPNGFHFNSATSFHATLTEKRIFNLKVTSPTNLVTLADKSGSNLDSYSGKLLIGAYAGSSIDGDLNCASYELIVSKGGFEDVKLVASSGVISGDSANHPSFTFSMLNNNIKATPVGSTSGNFSFIVTSMGNISIL